jgi:formate dehydrogenase accessory protein FdhD
MRMESLSTMSPGTGEYASESWNAGQVSPTQQTVAEEVPVALVYNGISHAVMLATPEDLVDFGVGFSLSEGIVAQRSEIHDCEVTTADNGISVELNISSARFAALKDRRRNLAGRTGCGLCGTESLDQVFRPLPPVRSELRLDVDTLHRAVANLKDRQPLHALTGAIHAAAWVRGDSDLVLVREDVGRHNALDKLIGAMVQFHIGFDDGFCLLTSRASSEMVQKAAIMGMPVVAAISAPTGLAIRLAEQSGVTLVGFVRGERHAVYTHAGRIRAPARLTP